MTRTSKVLNPVEPRLWIVLALLLSMLGGCRGSDTGTPSSSSTNTAASVRSYHGQRRGEPEKRLPADVFDVQLRPPVFRWIGNDRITLVQRTLQSGARESRSFSVPRLKGIGFALYADTLVRFALRSPSGKTLIPGETPENAEYRVLAVDQGRSWILAVGNPEAGEWTVTTEAARLTGPTRYYFDVRADDPVVEETHVEVFSRDGDPRTVNSVPPGEPVYVRVFVATGELAVPGVRWNVVATSYDGPPIPIAVEDDGHHADGAAGDGVFVGAFVAAEEPLHWINVKATTPQGTRYTEESRVEVMERGDLLIADTIEVSPDPRGGIPVTLTVTVENKGTLDFKNVNLDLFLALGETKWEEKGARQTFDIRAGESRRVSTSWIPSPRQEYLVRLTIEPFLEPFTSDLANNTRKTIVRVR